MAIIRKYKYPSRGNRWPLGLEGLRSPPPYLCSSKFVDSSLVGLPSSGSFSVISLYTLAIQTIDDIRKKEHGYPALSSSDSCGSRLDKSPNTKHLVAVHQISVAPGSCPPKLSSGLVAI
ncbi:hypothetical protein C8R43DRAFT_963393 [Mycena crocata]|nr:hypothetical protein C8R43DRAFT_963393 [Mycena crocata]